MATLITVKGNRIPMHPKKGVWSLEEVQKAVGGDFQVVAGWDNKRNVHLRLLVNEEGKLRGLVRNPYATGLMATAYDSDEYIVGNCLVLEPEEKLA